MTDVGRLIRGTIKDSRRRKFAEGGDADALPDVGEPLIGNGGEFSPGTRWARRLTGTQPGEERAQLWPERMVRSGFTLAHDVGTGEVPMHVMDQTTGEMVLNPEVIQRAQDMAGMAGGQTLLAGRAPKVRPELDARAPAPYKPVHEPEPQIAAPAEAGVDVSRGLAGSSGGTEGLRAAELQAQRRAGQRQPLEGLPRQEQIVEGEPFIPGPVARAHDVAERYMADKDFGLAPPDKYHPVDVEHARAIAKAFDEMPHTPNDPAVKAAYQALADETLAQYRAIKEHGGLKVTPVNAADYPYHGNPRAVVKDVADNNHMAFFKTNEGFGSTPVELAEHPLLKSSGVKVGDHDMLYNDLFRVVHDYFGHVKNGYGFRGAGEDNAWRAHAAMYSPLARRAMTTETRGQNSWLNYGPHGDFNRTASAADTIYAPQKIGLLPDWVMQDRVLNADSQAVGAPLAALENAPKFYSGLERAVETVQQPKMTGGQWLGTLNNKGAKPEEMQWSGLGEFLGAKKGEPVTKAEVQEHLGANKLELGETHLGEMKFDKSSPYALPEVIKAARAAGDHPGDLELVLANDGNAYRALTKKFPELAGNEDWASVVSNSVFGGDTMPSGTTKYHDYQLPGGENYREKLLTLPPKEKTGGWKVRDNPDVDGEFEVVDHNGRVRYGTTDRDDAAQYIRDQNALDARADTYRSSHWDQPNVVVHRRTNERDVLGDGEAQSFKLRNKTSGNTTKAFPTEEAALAQLEKLPETLRPNLEVVPAGALPKRSLHLEEIQSDWHQEGRRQGYRQEMMPANERPQAIEKLHDLEQQLDAMYSRRDTGEYAALRVEADMLREKIAGKSGLPDAPFKKNWHELALKDALREAAEQGHDRISWTPGAAQAKRYDLSQHVRDIVVVPHTDGGGRTWWPTDTNGKGMGSILTDKNGVVTKAHAAYGDIVGKSIDDVIGKDVAAKGHAATTETKLSGADLSVGGEGMKGFYDKIIPAYLNKIGKPHGVKVEKGSTGSSDGKIVPRAIGGYRIDGDNAGVGVFSTLAEAEAALAKLKQPVHYMDIPQSLKDQVLKKGFSLFEDSAATGAPLSALENERRILRYPFPDKFPNVVVQRGPGSAVRIKDHPHYAGAKAGDIDSAMRVVNDVIDERAMAKLQKVIGDRKPEVVPVHAVESGGVNALPRAYAHEVADRFHLPVNNEIVQSNRAFRTGQGAAYRMRNRAEFAGNVNKGDHLLVDDAVTMGGTLADLHSHIASGGGNTLGATTLMASPFSHILAPTRETLARLRDRLPQLEPWWKEQYGHGFEGLTNSEAQYLSGFSSTDAIRNRLTAGERPADGRGNTREASGSGKAAGGAVSYPTILQRFAEGGDVEPEAGPVFDPARLAALHSNAPVFDPAKLAAAKPKSMSAGDVLSGVVENAPSSAWQFAKDVVRPVTHPVETLGGIKDLGLGLLEKSGLVGTGKQDPWYAVLPPTGGGHEQYADAMGEYLKNRYGGWENIKKSVAQDPVGVLSDASMVLTGGGSGAARAPGIIGKAGEVAGNIGRAVDPLMAPVNAARAGTKAVGELLTHTGGTPLQNAYKAGVEGGEAGDIFRGHMRGTSDSVEPVEMAKRGLAGYRAERGKNYREGMGDITSIDRQMDPLDRVLDFGKINKAVDETQRYHKFGVMDTNKPAAAIRDEMMGEIAQWQAAPPATYHTLEGLDALKKSLGGMMMNQTPGTPARAAASEIYNAVKKTIVEYDPKYAQVMKDYELASTQIRELERAMSLGEKASADTALRKLQSIMRNNVNTNYGRRLELGKLLEENGAKHLMAALSGQSLNAWFPRGLGKIGAELAVLGGLSGAGHAGAGALGGLGAVAALPLMSPRLMGEVAHGAGRTVGRGLNMSNRALGNVGLNNRTLGNASYRLGRTTNPYENAPDNPYAP